MDENSKAAEDDVIETLTLPDGLIIPARGHASDCDVFFARKRGCCCAVAREVRLQALLAELEWSGGSPSDFRPSTAGTDRCIVCNGPRPNHKSDCCLAAALHRGAP